MNPLTQYEKSNFQKQNSPILFSIWQERGYFSAHWHEHTEILFFKTNGYKVTVNGTTYETQKGDMLLINGYEPHSSVRLEDETIFYVLRINTSFLADASFQNYSFPTRIQGDHVIRDYFDKLCEESTLQEPGYELELKGITYRLLCHLLRNYKSGQLSPEEISLKQNKLRKINSILEYIAAHYSNPLTTADLAKQFHLNEQYFCRYFKKETGQSVTGYINQYRSEIAASFLKESDYSITEIALLVGFTDSNYFARIFKKYTGVSPREYKKTLGIHLI
ncbi:MAG: helix-turn-helix transcriptional regulator [Clostridia bacterium]|nr:helix-turn-helix transcriptional regulator [Clostridia bacterium]